MKKTIALLLSVFLLLTLFSGCDNTKQPQVDATTTQADTTANNPTVTEEPPATDESQPNPESDFLYEVNEDDGITITRYIGQRKVVVIPDLIQNKPVTQIGILAFVTKSTLRGDPSNIVTSLKMPDTVSIIGVGAFVECEQLEKINLSSNLTVIDAYAFQKCVKLKHITIPSKVQQIHDEAFDGSGLETVIFEEGIEVIGGYGSFAQTQLKQLILPSTVREIGHSTFAACPNLEIVVLNEGLVTIGHKSFCANPKLKEIIIPKTVKYVTEMVFTSCSGLEKIMFEGDAPETFEYSDEISGVWDPYNVHFSIYYHEGANGFTSPEWYGYPTAIW